jgi:hypothetical protein
MSNNLDTVVKTLGGIIKIATNVFIDMAEYHARKALESNTSYMAFPFAYAVLRQGIIGTRDVVNDAINHSSEYVADHLAHNNRIELDAIKLSGDTPIAAHHASMPIEG